MAPTNYYVRPTNGADVAGQGTTHATAYQTLQFALDDIGGTHGRDAVNGDQVNICSWAAEGAAALAATISLVAYGAPTSAAPLVLRGYTAVADDGGEGEISLPAGGPIFSDGVLDAVWWIDLYVHSTCSGAQTLITGDDDFLFWRCRLDSGGGQAQGVISCDDRCQVIRCSIAAGDRGMSCGYTDSVIAYNYITQSATGRYHLARYAEVIVGNICVGGAGSLAAAGLIQVTPPTLCAHNVCYGAGSGGGILVTSGVANNYPLVYNNVCCGFSGVGGYGIAQSGVGRVQYEGNNAFWNNTTDFAAASWEIIANAGDVALGADPFVNAAAGNFMLTDVAKAALRSAGWPATYLGAALTDPHLTIGPVQYGEDAGGGGYIGRPRWQGV